MAKQFTVQEALDYHSSGRPGKIEVIPTKSTCCQKDLAMAYSPGVAEPCMEIHRNPDDVYKYTSKGNLVAVISDGTAVLGLGDIGPLAGKPVMEGKGLLFKIFADIDVFDIEIDTKDPDKFIETCKLIAPTFGGINLEDIKAPECFYIEQRLKAELDIPLMHDDQHGTAIISGAALLNAAEIVGKKIDELQIVFNGAGASAVSCAKLYLALGVKKENLVMLDTKGVLRADRDDLNEYKRFFATDRNLHNLADAIKDADVFVGLSKGNVLTQDMVKSMAFDPIIFAMANPTPEISYEDAISARKSLIMATGRSDFPNQVNNVLGFPFIFRGAMDVKATCINEQMKLAATFALADLAKQPVPEEVNIAYNAKNLTFGREYIIPKPFDPRLITHISSAVAKAAMESGVARNPITDWDQYIDELSRKLGKKSTFIRQIRSRAKQKPMRVVFAEADNYKILKSAEIVLNENIAYPILLGNIDKINKLINEYNLDLHENVEIIDPRSPEESERRKQFADIYYKKRQRKGVTFEVAKDRMRHRNYFGPMLVASGYADAMLSGLTTPYPETVRPALEIIGKKKDTRLVSGLYIMVTQKGPVFFADTTVNMNPTPEDLVEITLQTVKRVKMYNIEPRVAILAYTNFGTAKGKIPEIGRQAVEILHRDYPDLIVDGEMQANFAVNNQLLKEHFPFSKLVGGPANVLIFPYLTAGNIAYKLVQEMSQSEAIGPILNGLKKSVHILQMGSSVEEIINMVQIAVIDAHNNE